jgi:hypothetical protein
MTKQPMKTTLSVLVFFVVVGLASAGMALTQPQSRQLERQTDSVKNWPTKAKRWALVIGVDQYRDGQNRLSGYRQLAAWLWVFQRLFQSLHLGRSR